MLGEVSSDQRLGLRQCGNSKTALLAPSLSFLEVPLNVQFEVLLIEEEEVKRQRGNHNVLTSSVTAQTHFILLLPPSLQGEGKEGKVIEDNDNALR